jgi:hypothetical protein
MELHPDWSEPEVARAVGCSQTTARNARKRREVQGVMAMTGYPLPSRGHELAVARAPRELWPALGRAVQEAQQHQPSSADTTRHVADLLMNETLSEERKEAFLQYAIETGGCPGFTQGGEPSLGTMVQSGQMQQLYKEAEAVKKYESIMSAVRRYQQAHPVAEAAAILNGQYGLRNDRERVIRQTRETIAYLQDLLYRLEHPGPQVVPRRVPGTPGTHETVRRHGPQRDRRGG